MCKQVLTPDQETEAQRLAELLREASQDELLRIARLLVSKPETELFGQTEFAIRDLVLRIGAKAYETHLREKKTATRVQG